MRIVIDADVSKQIIHTLKSLSERQYFHEVLKLMQKTFVESKHPRDEEGRFASKGGYVRAKRLKLKEKLKDYVGKDIKNEKTGILAYISNESINKISSEKVIEKTKANGFTVDDHFYAASNIVPLFKKADLMGVYKDKNNSKDIVSIKRFHCRFRLPSGVAANAYITVKEARISGHKIYSLEVMELEKALKNEGLGMAVRKSNATCIPENTPPRTFSIPDSQKKARERETHQTDEQQQFHEVLKLMQKTFVESKHPRDEAGRFTDKREEKTCLKENISSASDVKQALEAIKNTDIVNKKTGIIARISSTGINKMISNKAVEKSEANGFTRQEHYRAAAQIKDLFEKAHLIEARADKNNDPNIQSIKRFYSSVVLEDGREGKALITLKETYQSGHRIYTVELNRIIKPIDMRKAVAQYAQSAYSPSTSKGWETTDTHARTRTEQKAPTDFSIPHSKKKARARNVAGKDFNAIITVKKPVNDGKKYYHHYLQDIQIEPPSRILHPANKRDALLLDDSLEKSIPHSQKKARA
ncbi:hypothetical protein HMPREF9554_01870, partial [Treponema phagedenis F0421]|uniref:LPD3 domain-containing protein n=1 Tax=Treponema phagedenis TaxID=162 RepID=UPI0001F63CE1